MTIKEFFKNDIFATNAGIEIESAGKGFATAVMRVEPEHLNAGGTTQGAAIFTLADLALAEAANSSGKLSFSIASNIQFFKGS